MPTPIKPMHIYQCPFGLIGLSLEDGHITQLDLSPEKDAHSPLPVKLKIEFDRYFKHPTHIISLPTKLIGTDFQKEVWRALQTIAPGTTLTYGELAKKLGSHPRAIGQACRRNPIPLIYPCHRVVSATDLGGFSGERTGNMVSIKKWLLQHEGLA